MLKEVLSERVETNVNKEVQTVKTNDVTFLREKDNVKT